MTRIIKKRSKRLRAFKKFIRDAFDKELNILFNKAFQRDEKLHVCVIGTSPISLIAAVLIRLFGHRVTILESSEKTEVGGAWKSTYINGELLPRSLHFVMPCKIAYLFLSKIFNLNGMEMNQLPSRMKGDGTLIGPFPCDGESNGSLPSYDCWPRTHANSNQLLLNNIVDIANLEGIEIKYESKVQCIKIESDSLSVLHNMNGEQKKFDRILLTNGTILELEFSNKKITPNPNFHKNISCQFYVKCQDVNINLVHFDGNTTVREIQILYNRKIHNGFFYGVAKLSKKGAELSKDKRPKAIKDAVKLICSGLKEFEYLGDFEYENVRLDYDFLNTLSKQKTNYIDVLPFGLRENMSDILNKEQTASQDLGPILATTNFYRTILATII